MDQPHTQQQTSAAAQATSSQWPDGWYVYENGRVDGPLTADEAFALDAETSEGKPRLISRKGFSQWYALRDLSEIFRMTAHLGQKTALQGMMSEAQLAGVALQPTPIPPPPDRKQGKVRGRQVDIGASGRSPPQPSSNAATKAAPPPFYGAAAVEARQPGGPRPVVPKIAPAVAAPAVAAAAPAVSSAPATSLSFGRAAPTGATLSRPVSAKQPRALNPAKAKQAALMQEYFLARGRLRLGKLRSPWVAAFLGVPLTLGGVWVSWFGTLAREIAFHCRNQDKSPLPPTALALVPLAHFYMVYRLGQLINEMEAQNRYRRVSPRLAAVLAIVPPVAMVYLQDSVNRHWMLHAQHALIAKQQPDAALKDA